jgi:hypothetical protein
MNKAKAPLLIALATIMAASACLVTLPVPVSAPATLTPDLAVTGQVQTLTAAPTATFTATLVPDTATPTTTLTPFPSITPLPTATSTPTETPFGYFETHTPIPPTATIQVAIEAPDPAEGATDDWGSDYRCTLLSKTPPNWTVIPGKTMYKVSWTLRNSGRKSWEADGILLLYIDGNKLGPEKLVNLKKDVKVGEKITPVVNIFTPKEAGNYRTVWAMMLRKTSHVFCTFTIKITVP